MSLIQEKFNLLQIAFSRLYPDRDYYVHSDSEIEYLYDLFLRNGLIVISGSCKKAEQVPLNKPKNKAFYKEIVNKKLNRWEK